MAFSLDGVVVIADPVAREGTPRRKVMPSLLPRLGTPGPRSVELLPEVSSLLPAAYEM
jgi:hypothetical protein